MIQHKLVPVVAVVALVVASYALAAGPDVSNRDDLGAALAIVRDAEARRVALIDRIAPSVVCVYDKSERGGGSGVIIDAEGYGLTNFHVVRGMMGDRRGRGGLNDGWIYDIEVLGIDPIGDVAMFRMLGRESFPFTVLGDSDRVRLGDAAIVLGNPFVLSEDQTPSASYGIVTGVQRYQGGTKGALTYTDCLQVDAPINPGNSGGPLYNDAGEIIGINGRISINARGRFNVGFGYAIASNQIARFIPTLRAGLLATHGTMSLGLDDVSGVGLVIHDVPRGRAGDRAGLRAGDVLVAFDGQPTPTRNRYVSLMGTYPGHWPLFVEVLRDGERQKHFARLDPIAPKLRKPYKIDREINLRQIRRVIGRFQAFAALADHAQALTATTWSVERADLADPENPTRAFAATVSTRTPKYADGRLGSVVEFDDRSADRFPSGGDPVSLPSEDQMLLSAQFVVWQMMTMDVKAETFAGVSHVGGDALVRPMAHRLLAADASDGGALLEVIDWPISEKGSARFAFDAATGRLERITLKDSVTSFEATLYLTNYRELGGHRWPFVVETYAGDSAYVERIKTEGEAGGQP